EHFKRLRNAYSEWREWARQRKIQGQPVHSCQDCHMSRFPGGCVPGEPEAGQHDGCPEGTRFEPQPPGSYPEGLPASNSATSRAVRPHYFTGVDLPLAPEFPSVLIDEQS